MPYITLTIPSGTTVGQTVDATIGNMPARVTLLTDKTLRIEPDDVGTIIAATTEDGRTTLCVTSRRTQVGGGR
jgi:hypothetical protein